MATLVRARPASTPSVLLTYATGGRVGAPLHIIGSSGRLIRSKAGSTARRRTPASLCVLFEDENPVSMKDDGPETSREATFAEVFPPDAITARFVLSMAMAANDLERALRDAVAAQREERPDLSYRARLVAGHLVEALDALEQYSHDPAVKNLMAEVPPRGRKELAKARRARQTAGRRVLDAMRNHTFHYPSPKTQYRPTSDAQLRDVLKRMGGGVRVFVDGDTLQVTREFADSAALSLALAQHGGNPRRIRQAFLVARDAAAAFRNWEHLLFLTYRRVNGLTMPLANHTATE